MKQPLLFLFVFTIIGSTSASDDKRLEFSVKEARRDTSNIGRAQVVLELKNLTNDTLIFLTSTHHEDLFSVLGDSVSLNLPKYEWSNPEFLKLLPHQNYSETISVVSIQGDANFPPFKVKINLVETEEKGNPRRAAKEVRKKRSNLITDYIQIK